MTKVKPLFGRTGKPVANQYVIEKKLGNGYKDYWFQSYDSIIVYIDNYTPLDHSPFNGTYLDKKYWNYSMTTSKYRNQFLNETTKETQAKIDSGQYKLVDLNS